MAKRSLALGESGAACRRSQAGGDGDDREAAADAALAAHGFLLGSVRLFSERRLLRKIRRELEIAPRIAEDGWPDEVVDYLIERRIDQALRGVQMTKLQRNVCELFLRGSSVSEITTRLGLSHQRVSHAITLVRNRIRTKHGKYEGLQEVYWREVRKTIYRKPQHGWR